MRHRPCGRKSVCQEWGNCRVNSAAREDVSTLRRLGPLPRGHVHYLGLRNFRMNWSVCPRIVASNTLAVRGSAGLARIELSESNLNPAASTSRRTVEDSMRCNVSVTFAGAPGAAE